MRDRRRFVVIGALALAVLVASLIAIRTSTSRAQAVTVSPVATTITINSAATFAPPPANAAPALTAAQAYAQDQQEVGGTVTTIPSDVNVQLGLFTLEVGPDCGAECGNLVIQNGIAYRTLNELAYGYSWPSCPPDIGSTAPPPPSPCVGWTFVDANTGQEIVTTWQQ
jgi:hypothetical protein